MLFVPRSQSNYIYYFTYLVLLAELITSVVVLNTTWNDDCDTHLRVWLIGYVVRSTIYVPVVAYEHYFVVRLEDLNQHRLFKTIKMFFEIGALMWFVLGNSYVFGAQTCQSTAPTLYRVCLAWMILGYIGLGLPLFFCLGLIFCFPCVYLVMQYLASRPDPLVESVINRLPTKTFRAGMYSEEDAVCAICLVPYEPSTELRILSCNHHFHKSCADDWFRIKPHCPLCRKPIDGSSAEELERGEAASGSSASRANVTTRRESDDHGNNLPAAYRIDSPLSSEAQQVGPYMAIDATAPHSSR